MTTRKDGKGRTLAQKPFSPTRTDGRGRTLAQKDAVVAVKPKSILMREQTV